MRLELVQGNEVLFDREKNASFIMERLDKSDAELIVFPELFLTGYVINERAFELAENRSSKLMREIALKAKKKKKSLIFGGVEEDEAVKGVYYNSAFVIDEHGEIGTYRKISLPNFGPFNEKRFFREGKETRAFTLNGARVGVLICYDLFFPALSSSLMGSDVLVYISASPYTSKSAFEALLGARAIENSLYVVYVNMTGREESTLFWGGSRVIDPSGMELTRMGYFERGIGQASIDLDRLSILRTRRPVIRDTKEIKGDR